LSQETSIEWTHRPGTIGATWNPVVGCNRVSPGCLHCYAEVMAARIANAAVARPEAERTPTQRAYMEAVKWRDGKALPRWSGKAILIPDKLSEPLRRKRPTTYFVNSMSDLFHETLSFEQIAAMFGVMWASREHTHLILTKRPGRAAEWFEWAASQLGRSAILTCIDAMQKLGISWPAGLLWEWPLPNVELGTSVENQETADERIPHLLRCPAAVRFISYEPALGPAYFGGERGAIGCYVPDTAKRKAADRWRGPFRGSARRGIDQIIIGGETGAGHRPMDVAWVESVDQQTREAGVALFVKQDSGPRPGAQGHIPDRLWARKEFPEPRHA
jgi:protein gp37